jgi:hypothetical protein
MRGEAYTEFWYGNLNGKKYLRDPGIDVRVILRWIFRKWNVAVGTESGWIRIGTGGGHF